jgi:hypothetical protein
MYLRKIFQEFLVLQTDAEPAVRDDAKPNQPWPCPATKRPPLLPTRTGTFDWRWLETVEDAA